MSADSFHHQVELSMKQCSKIYDFTDYEQCLKNSNSGKVDVKSLQVSDFRDWPDVSSIHKISKMTPKPYLADSVWLRAKRGKYTVDYKVGFHQQAITCNFLTAE